ncbi:MAG TPA: S1C family serine protease [Steroidobacteraceae bacterium]|nr:S1C family serine protease [Steroidobacteraceae bacterium]
MSTLGTWAFPERLQPRQELLRYDLEAALQSVVLLHAEVPDNAFTAAVLGTERIGHGVVIGHDGLVVTIGYLVTEARSIWLTTNSGAVLPGHVVGYDQVTGLGLVQPLGRLDVPAMPRGSASGAAVGDGVTVIGHGGLSHALDAKLIAKREFAGYWEYLLEEAVFTAPAHPQWGGAALVNRDGRLLGVGSLLVQEARGARTVDANMFVPIDLLEPILDDMLRLGRPSRAARPWLGMYATSLEGVLVVGGLTPGGPAQRAGMRPGDVLLEVAGEPVGDLADMLRRVWSIGPAGAEIGLTVARGGSTSRISVKSADRSDYLTKPRTH